jgi:hypothetical protein
LRPSPKISAIRFWSCPGHSSTVNPIAAGLLAAQLVGEPITANLVAGLGAVFAGIRIATTEGKKP